MQINNDAFVDKMIAVMRESDKAFEDIGGSTRHYVRDVLFPFMKKAGLFIVDSSDVSSAIKIITAELGKDKSPNSYYYSWQASIAVSFQDACSRWMQENEKGFIPIDVIHELSNTAAKEFLDLLISVPELETPKE